MLSDSAGLPSSVAELLDLAVGDCPGLVAADVGVESSEFRLLRWANSRDVRRVSPGLFAKCCVDLGGGSLPPQADARNFILRHALEAAMNRAPVARRVADLAPTAQPVPIAVNATLEMLADIPLAADHAYQVVDAWDVMRELSRVLGVSLPSKNRLLMSDTRIGLLDRPGGDVARLVLHSFPREVGYRVAYWAVEVDGEVIAGAIEPGGERMATPVALLVSWFYRR